MLTNPTPAGYYTAAGASALEDAYLCLAGRYCARGTSASKVQQSECLPGYFCPLGTAASLNLDGTFGADIHMEPRNTLVAHIGQLIVDNQKRLDAFGIDSKRTTLRAVGEALAGEQAKRVRNATRVERLQTDQRAQQWAIDRWEATVAATKERRAYLATISTPIPCPADRLLPQELVKKYFRGGAQLRCPQGTSSARASECLGQCTKPLSSA
jgi:hypothetical protein